MIIAMTFLYSASVQSQKDHVLWPTLDLRFFKHAQKPEAIGTLWKRKMCYSQIGVPAIGVVKMRTSLIDHRNSCQDIGA